jgi:hypothetical protein
MLPNFRNGRTNVGTVSLGPRAHFSGERSLAITLSESDLTGRIPRRGPTGCLRQMVIFQGERAKQLRANLSPGDLLVFYAGLAYTRAMMLVYAIIGLRPTLARWPQKGGDQPARKVTIGREVALGGSRAGHGLHDDAVLQRNGAQAVGIGKVVMTPCDAVVRDRMT